MAKFIIAIFSIAICVLVTEASVLGECPSRLPASSLASLRLGCRSDSHCSESQKCCAFGGLGWKRCVDAVHPCSLGASSTSVQQIIQVVMLKSAMVGMQAAAFKVGEYNSQVAVNFPDERGQKMQLPNPDNTLAFTITYNSEQYGKFSEAVAAFAPMFAEIEQLFSCHQIRYIGGNDFNTTIMLPTVHIQTAAHASGNAFYYQKTQVTNPPSTWDGQTIFGVSINNDFRLGTVFTAVLVFEDVQSDAFHPQPPVDVYFTEAEKIMLLSWINGLAKPPFVATDHDA